jgi:hypothetical protein
MRGGCLEIYGNQLGRRIGMGLGTSLGCCVPLDVNLVHLLVNNIA